MNMNHQEISPSEYFDGKLMDGTPLVNEECYKVVWKWDEEGNATGFQIKCYFAPVV